MITKTRKLRKNQLAICSRGIGGGCGDPYDVQPGATVKLGSAMDEDGEYKVYPNKDHETRDDFYWVSGADLTAATPTQKARWN